MVEFSHFYELCECKNLGEVLWEHGYKRSRRRKINWVPHLFRRLVNLFNLLQSLVKPFQIFYEDSQVFIPL